MNIGSVTGAARHSKVQKWPYEIRKVMHWQRMGTPSQLDPETGAATPNWVIEERNKRREREAKAFAAGGYRISK